jgi:hypothetical protein
MQRNSLTRLLGRLDFAICVFVAGAVLLMFCVFRPEWNFWMQEHTHIGLDGIALVVLVFGGAYAGASSVFEDLSVATIAELRTITNDLDHVQSVLEDVQDMLMDPERFNVEVDTEIPLDVTGEGPLTPVRRRGHDSQDDASRPADHGAD